MNFLSLVQTEGNTDNLDLIETKKRCRLYEEEKPGLHRENLPRKTKNKKTKVKGQSSQ